MSKGRVAGGRESCGRVGGGKGALREGRDNLLPGPGAEQESVENVKHCQAAQLIRPVIDTQEGEHHIE